MLDQINKTNGIKPDIVRALLYARVSGDDRGKDGRNLAGQLEMCREYAECRRYRIVAELSEDDRGASGASIDLPQLNRIRDMAANHEFDVLIVRELDRLSRNLAKQLIIEEELRRYGVKIEYVLAEYDDSPEGRLQKHIKAVIAEFEREKSIQRTSRGKKIASKKGKILAAGMSPYGYSRIEDGDKITFEINETEAKTVRQIFHWYIEGKSYRTIANKLNQLTVPRWVDVRKKDKHRITDAKQNGWSQAVICKIICNETYAGVWHYGKYNGRLKKANGKNNWIPITVPAIVSREIWEAAQRQRTENTSFAKRNNQHNYLLRGRIKCTCGYSSQSYSQQYKYKGELRGTNYYYRCGACNHTDKSRRCKMPHFRVDKVDDEVWNWIRSILVDEDKLQQGFEDYRLNQKRKNEPILRQLEITESLIAQREKELDNKLTSLDAVLSKRAKLKLGQEVAQLEDVLDKLEAQKNLLEAQLQTDSLSPEQIADIERFAAKIRQGLSKADPDFTKRRKIIDLLDVRATMSVEDGKKTLFVVCHIGKYSYELPNKPRLVVVRL